MRNLKVLAPDMTMPPVLAWTATVGGARAGRQYCAAGSKG
jgi:hypothetical protein